MISSLIICNWCYVDRFTYWSTISALCDLSLPSPFSMWLLNKALLCAPVFTASDEFWLATDYMCLSTAPLIRAWPQLFSHSAVFVAQLTLCVQSAKFTCELSFNYACRLFKYLSKVCLCSYSFIYTLFLSDVKSSMKFDHGSLILHQPACITMKIILLLIITVSDKSGLFSH